MEIGQKIKHLRLKNGLTQEELGDRCEYTKGFISQIENDQSNLTVSALGCILDVLGTNYKDFFNEDEDEKVVFEKDDYIIKKDDISELSWLVTNAQKNSMEPIIIKIMPLCKTTPDSPHDGEEFGYILKGRIKLYLGKKVFNAKKGDSFYFMSNKIHCIENTGDTECEILWLSCPPTF